MENKNQSKIREIVSAWIEHAQIQQKDLSSEINVTPASLNKFLKADGVLFPFPRFLQIVHKLNPPQEEITEAFGYFLAEWKLPIASFQLLQGKLPVEDIVTARARVHALVEKLSFEQIKMVELMLNGLLTTDKQQ